MRGQWRELLQLMLRDGLIAAAVLGLWAWQVADPPQGSWRVVLAVVTALATTLIGYLSHEWGHLLGALAARARFELPKSPFESPFLFKFDRAGNSRPQFFSMALGGFAASILSVALFALLLPWGMLATYIALALIALGVAATLVIEVPEFWRVWRGGPLPEGAAFVSQDRRD